MLYIDFDKQISPCLICLSHGRKVCQCTHLEIFVYETLLYYIKEYNGIASENSHDSLKMYQHKKAFFIPLLKNKFPCAQTTKFYPFNTKELYFDNG